MKDELLNIISAFNDLKILIIGDVMLDAYLWGNVNRISPEAPVPVVELTKKEKRLGGAANVALNIKALGATPYILSVIGDDAEGKDFLALLDKRGISKDGIISIADRPTTIKHRILSGSQQMLRIDEESTEILKKDTNAALIEKFKVLIKNVDAVIFQDYDKGVLHRGNINMLIDICNTNNVPSIVDPKKANFDCYENVSLFKPNLKELKEGLGISIDKNDEKSIKDGVDQLKQRLNINNILLTLSEKGMYYNLLGQEDFIPSRVLSVSDVSGAGDTVVSISSLCFALQSKPSHLAELSNLGGGLVCEELGVVPVSKENLIARVDQLGK